MMQISSVLLYFLPVQTRVPYQFGSETMSAVTCARVRVVVRDASGRTAEGWGETPLSVQWVWPGALPFQEREAALQDFCLSLADAWSRTPTRGHPLEIGHAFLEDQLPGLLAERNRNLSPKKQMPWLAALVATSPFDLALYDAFGNLVGKPVYETLSQDWLERDLSTYLEPAPDAGVSFAGLYPEDFLVSPPATLPVWHSVGGTDPLTAADRTGNEPEDAYPNFLPDWIRRDGLRCLKVKLRGHDAEWDYERLVAIGQIGIAQGVDWLCADYNCTATDVAYVTAMLDRLLIQYPRIFGMLLYVEQPFSYDLKANAFDVRAISARKPLFMDESAHDWRLIRLGRELGWTGVALKTCKTQTMALLSLCWARAHGMTLMVQDLTNPMLALIPHAALAAHAGTVCGLECNAAQFYPAASDPEAAVHPGLYERREGQIDLSTLTGPGFGYRLDAITRTLPSPAFDSKVSGFIPT